MRFKGNQTQPPTQQTPNNVPITQRRLKTKPTLILLAALLIGNLFWFILWLLPSNNQGGNEQVAVVDGEKITKQQWLIAMEDRYGKETLQTLINEKVMKKAAKSYGIDVSDAEVDFEILLRRSTQDVNDSSVNNLSDKRYREKVRNDIILEKVVTKDLVLSDADVQKYYEDNKSLYNVPTTYKTRIIVVATEEEAAAVKDEIKNGSDFEAIAREKSIDLASASLGGSIGFVSSTQANIDAAITQIVPVTPIDDVSNPIALSNGTYAIVLVDEIIQGQSFTFDQAKGHAKRLLAMEQLPSTINTEMFWSEFNVEWFYGENK